MSIQQIIQKPIKVICINSKNSTKLLEGGIYYAISLYDTLSMYGTAVGDDVNKKVNIKGFSHYDANNFKLETGDNLETLDCFKVISNYLDCETINYTGQYVICTSSHCKLKEDEIYYVERQIKIKGNCFSANLKIKGIKNPISSYYFGSIPISEQRLFKLKCIKGDKIQTGDTIRKFLLYTIEERNNILLTYLTRILIDITKSQSYHNAKIDIKSLIIKKGKQYDIIEDDVDEFFKLDIKNIVGKYNIKI